MKKEKKTHSTAMAYSAEKALKRAVAKAIAEHRRNGIPIAIWRNGKVVRLHTDQKEVREEQSKYKKGTHKKRDMGSKQLKK
jgi:hypothetical protein